MAKDPVCGMDVDPEHAAGQYEYKGETYYFCNPGCLEKFSASPEKFLHGKPAMGSPPHPEHSDEEECKDGYICPMHPEETSDGPSSCKK